MFSKYRNTKPVSMSKTDTVAVVPLSSSKEDMWTDCTDPLKQKATSNIKMRRNISNLQGGAKLKPIYKNSVNPIKLRGHQTDVFSVLPSISPGEPRPADTMLSILSGQLNSQFQQQQQQSLPIFYNKVQLCLCTNYPELRREHEMLITRALPEIQQFCADRGLTLDLTDVQYHQPKPLLALLSSRPTQNDDDDDGNDDDDDGRKVRPQYIHKHSLQLFVYLLGDNFGQQRPACEITDNHYKILCDAAEAKQLSNLNLLNSCYDMDENALTPLYVLKRDITDAARHNLIELLSSAATAARDESQLNLNDFDKFATTDVEDIINIALGQSKSPNICSFFYRRQIVDSPTNSFSDTKDAISTSRSNVLWETVVKMSHSNAAKQYVVQLDKNPDSTDLSDSQLNTFLCKLCTDFVQDVTHAVEQTASSSRSRNRRQLDAFAVCREVSHHTAFCARAASMYLGRKELFANIRLFLKDPKRNNKALVLYGPPGCGKTSTMVSIATMLQTWFSVDFVMAIRFLGTSSDSLSIRATVVSLTKQISLAYGLQLRDHAGSRSNASGTRSKSLISGGGFGTLFEALVIFRDTIETVSKDHASKRPLVILLDGIDTLVPNSESLQSLWAIKNLPKNVHVILSCTRKGDEAGIGATTAADRNVDFVGALLALVTNKECIMELPPLTIDEISWILDDYLARSQRRLTPEQAAVLLSAAQATALPRDLVALCRAATAWCSFAEHVELPRISAADAIFIRLLEESEVEFGKDFVRSVVCYIAVLRVGVVDHELRALLMTNFDTNSDAAATAATGIDVSLIATRLSALCHRLADFLQVHIVYGRIGKGWRHQALAECVVRKYGLATTAKKSSEENAVVEDSSRFTVSLHERIVDLYASENQGAVTEKDAASVSEVGTSHKSASNHLSKTRTPDLLRFYRLPHHLKVLLPIEGLKRAKQLILFNFRWLLSKLKSCPVYEVVNDAYSFYQLSMLVIQESIINDVCDDIRILYEMFQKNIKALSTDPNSLAGVILSSLGKSADKYSNIRILLTDAQAWLSQTKHKLLVPLTSIWTRPDDTLKYEMDGPTHVIGVLRSNVAVTFSAASKSIEVWSLESGELRQNFPVRLEQSMNGILAGKTAEFIINMYYSRVTNTTELSVLSTESGIELIGMSFKQEFEAIALDDQDELLAAATRSLTASESNGIVGATRIERVIVGVAVRTKQILFSLTVGATHHLHGISRLMFCGDVTTVGSETHQSASLLSLGSRFSQDLVIWNLRSFTVDFRVDLDFSPDCLCLSVDRSSLCCGSREAGAVLKINLNDGSLERTIEGADYVGMMDIAISTDGESAFIATKSLRVGINVVSLVLKSVARNICHEGEAVPTKLLVVPGCVGKFPRDVLIAGYDDGSIWLYGAEDGINLGRLVGHKNSINSLHICNTSRLRDHLLSAGEDNAARLWNIQHIIGPEKEIARENTGEKCRGEGKSEKEGNVVVIDGSTSVSCFVLSIDEKTVITGTANGLIQMWDLATGFLLTTFNSNSDDARVVDLYLACDDEYLIGHCTNKRLPPDTLSLQVWTLKNGIKVILQDERIQADEIAIYCSKLLPSSDRLMTIGPCIDHRKSGLSVSLYNLTTRKRLNFLNCDIYGSMNALNMRIIGFTAKLPTQADQKPTTTRLIQPRNKSPRSSSLNAQPPRDTFPTNPKSPRNPTPHVKTPSTSSESPQNAKTRRRSSTGDNYKSAPLSARKKRASSRGSVHAAENGLIYAVLDYFPAPELSFFFVFVFGGPNLNMISMIANEPLQMNTVHPACSVVLPSSVCISGSTDGQLIFWSARKLAVTGSEFVDGGLPVVSSPHKSKSLSVTIAGDQKVGGKFDRQAIQTPVVQRVPKAHESAVTFVVVGDSGKLLISGDRDGFVKVWNIVGKHLVMSFTTGRFSITCLSLTADQSTLAVASVDDSLSLWSITNVKKAEKLTTMSCLTHLSEVRITSDKKRIVCRTENMFCDKMLIFKTVNL